MDGFLDFLFLDTPCVYEIAYANTDPSSTFF